MGKHRSFSSLSLVGLAIAFVSTGFTPLQNGTPLDMIRNGDFEGGAMMPGWSPVREGVTEGSVTLDTEKPSDPQSPHSLRIVATNLGTRLGIANEGFGGMGVQRGVTYDVAFRARNEGRHVGLVFSLESLNGRILARTALPEIGGDWQTYTVVLIAHDSDPKARLVIAPIEATTIWLDTISLAPRKDSPDRSQAK